MEGSLEELAIYRYNKALEDIQASEVMLNHEMYKASINRSYYSIFHGLRAVTILLGYDSSKHSGIIAFFNQHYIKTSIFNKKISKIVKSASLLREKSDYEDFYIASRNDALIQLENGKLFLEEVEKYLMIEKII